MRISSMTVGSKSSMTALGTYLPLKDCAKNVCGESSSEKVSGLAGCPSGLIPC